MLKQKVMLMALILIVGLAGHVRADLIAYWAFDEGTGDTGEDQIGDNDAAITNPVWVLPGKVGDAAIEVSGGDEINCGPGPTPTTEDLTLAWWMIDNHGSYGTIMDKSAEASTRGYNILVRPPGDGGPLRFRIGGWQSYGGWGDECRIPDGAYNDGEWVHITCTYDSATDTATIYVNGELAENGTLNPKTGIAGDGGYCDGVNNPDEPLYIHGGAETFNGIMDEVAIWDNALTADEVRDVYEFGPQPAGAKNPNPQNRETVSTANPLTLSWTNMAPNDSNDLVYVDVLWGTEPNALSPGYDMTLVVTAENVDFVDVDSSAEDTYYWRVDSYLNGADNINEPNRFEGQLWSYTAVDDAAPTVEIVTPDQMTWLGEGVPLETTVTDDGVSGLTYLWTADPPHGVSFDDDGSEDPIVTFTNRILIVAIQEDDDDAEEHVNTQAISGADPQGTMVLDSSDLEVGSEGNGGLDWQVVAVQYADLGIPKDSTINSAKLTFTVDNNGAAGTSNDFTIYAEAADDASVFSTDPFDITDRTLSGASVPWNPPLFPNDDNNGDEVDTPDITALIQEVVEQGGWSANNRLTLMIYPDVYLASPTGGTTTVQELELEADPGFGEAVLTVTYEPPAGSPPLSGVSTYTITVAVSDEANPTPDTASIVIDVYDDPCQMAKFGEGKSAVTDFNANCISNLEDFAVIARAWLDDYSSTGPADRP